MWKWTRNLYSRLGKTTQGIEKLLINKCIQMKKKQKQQNWFLCTATHSKLCDSIIKEKFLHFSSQSLAQYICVMPSEWNKFLKEITWNVS